MFLKKLIIRTLKKQESIEKNTDSLKPELILKNAQQDVDQENLQKTVEFEIKCDINLNNKCIPSAKIPFKLPGGKNLCCKKDKNLSKNDQKVKNNFERQDQAIDLKEGAQQPENACSSVIESTELVIKSSQEIILPQSGSEITSEDFTSALSNFNSFSTHNTMQENMDSDKEFSIIPDGCRKDNEEQSFGKNFSSQDLVKIANNISDEKEASNVTFTDSHLTFVDPKEYVFQTTTSAQNDSNTKNRNTIMNLKVASENVELGRNDDSSECCENKKLGVEKFETFKEIMEKLKKDISVIMNSEDLKDDVDSNTNILNKFNLLDNILKQLYFIGKSLTNGGTYFIESLTAKRKEVSTLLSCLREEVFQAYLKLQPDEKYVVARRGGPMGCIFTLFGVLEREVRKVFCEMSNVISMRRTPKVTNRKLFKKDVFWTAKSVPHLKHNLEENDDLGGEQENNENVFVSTKDAETSMSGSFVNNPSTKRDPTPEKINISELHGVINLARDKKCHNIVNSNLLLNMIESDFSDSMRIVEKLTSYESEGFEICFIHNCIQITTPEKINFLIKNVGEPLNASKINNKTVMKLKKTELPGQKSSSSIITDCSGSTRKESTYFSTAESNTDWNVTSFSPSSSEIISPSESEFSIRERIASDHFHNDFTESCGSFTSLKTALPNEQQRLEFNAIIESLQYGNVGSSLSRREDNKSVMWDMNPAFNSQNTLAFNDNYFEYSTDNNLAFDGTPQKTENNQISVNALHPCKIQKQTNDVWNKSARKLYENRLF